jgi:predicted transcriptional regulator
MSITSIRLQPELEETLKDMAKKLQRSRNWLINQAVKEFIEKQASEEKRWQETLQALDSVKAGKVIDAEAVHAWLESWGADTELQQPKT